MLPMILILRRQDGKRKIGRKATGIGIMAMSLVETSECLSGLEKVAKGDVGVTDDFINVFRDYLKLDCYFRQPFAVCAFLKGQLINSSKLAEFGY